MRQRVLILCSSNSCRSQMAEGFWRHYAADRWEVFSAGISPTGVSPLAIEVMGEIGIDISTHRSKSTDEFVDKPFDMVVTVCSDAARNCPAFPGAKRKEHWPFDDPAGVEGTEPEVLEEFRRVRDEIGAQIRQWLGQT